MAKAPQNTTKNAPPPADDAKLEEGLGRALATIDADGSILEGGLDSALAVALNDSLFNRQADLAARRPRKVGEAIRNMVELATYDTPSAQMSIYSLPRDGKAIIGPSVRFAELALQMWKNANSDSRVVAVDYKAGYVEAEGIFHDIESNVIGRTHIRRRITNKAGKVYNADMIQTTSNAACAIARRNAILQGIPRQFWNVAYEKALAVCRGDEKTLGARRVALIQAFKDKGVTPAQVFSLIGGTAEQDIGLDQMVVLAGMFTAIVNGEATVEDILAQQKPTIAGPGLGGAFAQAGVAANETVDPKTGEVTETKRADPIVLADAAGPAQPAESARTTSASATPAQAASLAQPDSTQTQSSQPSDAGSTAVDAEVQEDEIEITPEEQEALDVFDAALEAADSWLVIKKATSTVIDALGENAELVVAAKQKAYDVTTALKNDPVRPDNDWQFFLLWLTRAHPASVKDMFKRLALSAGYDGQPQNIKDIVAEAANVASRVEG